MEKLETGQGIYNHGDRANPSHFGTIIKVKTDKWGTQYLIEPAADADHKDNYWISPSAFSEEFKGHSGTRIVTKEAHTAWHKKQYAAFKKSYNK